MEMEQALAGREARAPALLTDRSVTIKSVSRTFTRLGVDGSGEESAAHMSKYAALVNLISSVVGAGIMALPKTVSTIGWWPGILLLMVVTMTSALCCNLVHRAMLMAPQATNAEDLAESSFGAIGRYVVLVLNNLDLFSTCVILLVAGGDVVSIIFGPENQRLCIVGVAVVVALLSLPKDMSGLSKAASLGVLTLFMFMVVYVLDAVAKIFSPTRATDQVSGIWEVGAIAGAGSIMGFSYSCAILMPSMHAEMAIKEDLPWVINVGHAIVCTIYASVAVGGYAAYGPVGLDVKPEITSMTELPWAPVFCACCITVTILVGYPLFLNPVVVLVQNMLPHNPEYEVPTRYTVRLVMAGLTLVAALIIPYFYEIVLLTGAVSANLMCVILPVGYFLRLMSKAKAAGTEVSFELWLIPFMIIAVIQGIFVMIVGVYIGVLDLQAAINAGR